MEAKRAGIIPMTRLRNLLDRARYERAPRAAAVAAPTTRPFRIHDFEELEDDDDEELKMGISSFY